MTLKGKHLPGIPERNAEICALYKGSPDAPGKTLEQLADQYRLTRERVRQIVKDGGLTAKDRFKFANTEDQFLGVNVGADVKHALKLEASKRGVSVSSLSAKALKKMLVEMGYDNLGVV